MTTTSRRISQASKISKPSHTPGRTKGANCVRPNDFGIYTNGNPYKGAGMKGDVGTKRLRLSDRYAAANK